MGHEFEPVSYAVTRADLVRYAGASGDFNPIHWSDRVAQSVGLPGVVAHGMYTLALTGRALTDWVGSADQVVSFGTRFVKPVVVDDSDEGVAVTVSGVIGSVDQETATIEMTVTCGSDKVLGATRAVVRC